MKWDEMYEEFKKPFPKEALTEDTSRGFPLTSIKAQYIIERLNDVCGIDNWTFEGKHEVHKEGIVFFGTLRIIGKDQGLERSAEGFSLIKKNLGDSYKSARTDALSKAASMVGIGNSVFKGEPQVQEDKDLGIINKVKDMVSRCENIDQYFLMEEWVNKRLDQLTEFERAKVKALLKEANVKVRAF